MPKDSPCFVYITAPSKKEANSIGELLVHQKLAACVNIIDEMTSISKNIRILLNDNYIITKLKIDGFQKSKDETIKYKIKRGLH